MVGHGRVGRLGLFLLLEKYDTSFFREVPENRNIHTLSTFRFPHLPLLQAALPYYIVNVSQND